jgi:hypothetical protein
MYGSGQPEVVSGTQSDPYHDPYDKLSGYAKQKGYPPKTNTPGSSKYNPYKVLPRYLRGPLVLVSYHAPPLWGFQWIGECMDALPHRYMHLIKPMDFRTGNWYFH